MVIMLQVFSQTCVVCCIAFRGPLTGLPRLQPIFLE